MSTLDTLAVHVKTTKKTSILLIVKQYILNNKSVSAEFSATDICNEILEHEGISLDYAQVYENLTKLVNAGYLSHLHPGYKFINRFATTEKQTAIPVFKYDMPVEVLQLTSYFRHCAEFPYDTSAASSELDTVEEECISYLQSAIWQHILISLWKSRRVYKEISVESSLGNSCRIATRTRVYTPGD